jgi:hypothetical protein
MSGSIRSAGEPVQAASEKLGPQLSRPFYLASLYLFRIETASDCPGCVPRGSGITNASYGPRKSLLEIDVPVGIAQKAFPALVAGIL